MNKEQRKMVRNAAWILLQRIGLILSGICFAAVVPRLMGPEDYGRFALVFALGTWATYTNCLGLNSIMTRFMPEVILKGDRERGMILFGNIFLLRLVLAVIAAVIFYIATRLIITDINPSMLAIMTAAVIIGSSSGTLYTLFHALNRAARWGMSFLSRRWLMVFSVPAGYYLGGLPGAIGGLLATEVVVFAIGIGWARTWFSWRALKLDFKFLKPLLPFGLTFYGVALLYNTFRYSGEAVVRFISGSYDEVAFFGISVSLYTAAEMAITQFFTIFTPFLSALHSGGSDEEVRLWVERLLRGLTVAAMPVVFGAYFLAEEIIPLLLGDRYAPVVANVRPLSLSLVAIVPALAAWLLTFVIKRPGIYLQASAIRLGGFLIFSLFLIRIYGSLGACYAVFMATVLFAIYGVWKIRQVFNFSCQRWLLALLLAMPFLILLPLRSSPPVDLALFLFSTAGYFLLTYLSGMITVEEIRSVLRIIFQKD